MQYTQKQILDNIKFIGDGEEYKLFVPIRIMRKYYPRLLNNARHKAHSNTDEFKAYKKTYMKTYMRKYYQKNKEKMKKYSRKYYNNKKKLLKSGRVR